MARGLHNLIGALSASTGIDPVWRLTEQHFRSEGLPWISYGYQESPPNGRLMDALSNLPAAIAGPWQSDGLHRSDPMLRHASTSMQPRCFNSESFTKTNEPSEVRQHYRRLFSSGVRSTYVMPLRCVNRCAPGYFMLAGSQPIEALEQLVAECEQRLLLAAFYVDLRLQELFHRQLLNGVRLTPREKQCLELLSAGLRNERIAQQLGVSEVTVRLHFTNARNKLRTATREQAVAKATMLGLINP